MDIECSCGKLSKIFFENDEVKIYWCSYCGSLHIDNKKEEVTREVTPIIRASYFLLKSKERKSRIKKFEEGF